MLLRRPARGQRVHELHRRFRVVRAAALLQCLRLGHLLRIEVDLEQFLFDVADDLGARTLALLPGDLQVMCVEVLQVVRRHDLHPPHPLRRRAHVLGEEFPVPVEKFRKPVDAVDEHAALPAQMVQSGVDKPDIVGADLQQPREHPLQVDRDIAQADRAMPLLE